MRCIRIWLCLETKAETKNPSLSTLSEPLSTATPAPWNSTNGTAVCTTLTMALSCNLLERNGRRPESISSRASVTPIPTSARPCWRLFSRPTWPRSRRPRNEREEATFCRIHLPRCKDNQLPVLTTHTHTHDFYNEKLCQTQCAQTSLQIQSKNNRKITVNTLKNNLNGRYS
jgi:hypothetical protein